jgi:hypothetical protein
MIEDLVSKGPLIKWLTVFAAIHLLNSKIHVMYSDHAMEKEDRIDIIPQKCTLNCLSLIILYRQL